MRRLAVATLAVVGTIAAGAIYTQRDAAPAQAAPPAVGANALQSTARASLQSLVLEMRRRTASDPGDGEAAVLLADALVRSARVEGDAALALEAERVIRAALGHSPGDYGARRMLGVVLLSQHRFADAHAAAEDARRARPDDPWNYAVAGDALLELGRYPEAFDAFDALNSRRPDSGGYARAAYARELQGDIGGAIETMQMAVEGTGAHDPEAQAWYLSQLGNLYLLEGRLPDAQRAFDRADFVFPQHPYAHTGRARVLVAGGRYREAHQLLATGHDTPETWAMRGDLAERLGDRGAAASAYREAERLEREGWEQEEPQPAALARLLAERRLKGEEAVVLAERAASLRRDIHTLDALAWAYFQTGRFGEASDAITAALRTGTRDPRIRCHAEAIAVALQHGAAPRAQCDPLDLWVAPMAAIAGAPTQSAGAGKP